jgi:hypothetical protein
LFSLVVLEILALCPAYPLAWSIHFYLLLRSSTADIRTVTRSAGTLALAKALGNPFDFLDLHGLLLMGPIPELSSG